MSKVHEHWNRTTEKRTLEQLIGGKGTEKGEWETGNRSRESGSEDGRQGSEL